MNIEDAKIIVRSNIIAMKSSGLPGTGFLIDVFSTVLNHIDKIENENAKLKTNQLMHDVKKICGQAETEGK